MPMPTTGGSGGSGDTDVYAEEQALLAEINSATNSLTLANALVAQHHRGLLSKPLLSLDDATVHLLHSDAHEPRRFEYSARAL